MQLNAVAVHASTLQCLNTYLAYSLVGILKVLIISFHFDRQFSFKFSRSLLNEMSFDFCHKKKNVFSCDSCSTQFTKRHLLTSNVSCVCSSLPHECWHLVFSWETRSMGVSQGQIKCPCLTVPQITSEYFHFVFIHWQKCEYISS